MNPAYNRRRSAQVRSINDEAPVPSQLPYDELQRFNGSPQAQFETAPESRLRPKRPFLVASIRRGPEYQPARPMQRTILHQYLLQRACINRTPLCAVAFACQATFFRTTFCGAATCVARRKLFCAKLTCDGKNRPAPCFPRTESHYQVRPAWLSMNEETACE